MNYLVSGNDVSSLSFDESDTVKSVLQNIRIILSTPKGTVPLYRDFGINMEFLDLPAPAAEAYLRTEIRESVELWEPRARVTGVEFDQEKLAEGRLGATVEVEIIGEGQ